MKRACTEAENRVLREIVKDTTLFETKNSNVIPALLGLVLGIAVAVPIALAVRSAGYAAVSLALIICIAVMENICYFLIPKLSEKIGRKSKVRHVLGDRIYEVNGATVTGYYPSREDAWLEFAEDDVLAPDGRPYIISFAVQNLWTFKPGDRMMLVYSDTGAYIPMAVTEKTQGMIPMQAPDYWEEADKSQLPSIPHPNAVSLDTSAYRMNEQEREELIKKYRGAGRTKSIAAVVLLSVLVLLLFCVAFVVLVGTEVIRQFHTACIAATVMLLLWVLSTWGIARGLRGGYAKEFRKLEYKKRVMFHSMESNLVGDYSYVRELKVYEYVSGCLELVTYPINSNVLLPKGIKFGTVIYKYYRQTGDGKREIDYFAL